MAALWYCKIGDRQYGPLEADQLGTMAQKGKLTPHSLVRRGEDGRWVAASQVQGLRFSGSSLQLPKAKPLPPTPPPKPPTAPPVASIPVATAVAPAAATPVPAAAQPAAPAYDSADLVDDQEKRLSKSAVVLIVAGFACVLLVTVGVVVGMQFFGDDSKDEAVASSGEDDKGERTQEDDPELVSLETAADDPSTKPAVDKVPAKPKDPLRGYKVLKWAEWRGVRLPGVAAITLTAVGLDENSLAATGAASGVDEVLNEQALGLDPSKRPNTNIGRPTREDDLADAAADQPDRVFIRVQVTNLAPDSMTYVSFNGADAAVLADSNGDLCRLLPPAETPEATRIDTQVLPPGESVSDLLIFEAPKGEFESLRVLVPLTAVGKANYLGFTITAEQLGFADPAPEPASDADDADDVAAKKPSGGTGAPMREKDNDMTKDEKAEFDALQRAIDAGNDP